MSATDRLERDLTAWFGQTAVPRTPDYTDDILRQAARTRQRPRWSFPERWLPMSIITLGRVARGSVPWRTVGLLVALALLLAVAAAVYVGSSQRRVPAPFGAAANGLVAYSKGGDIYTVDPTTGTRRAIVTGSTTDEVPAFSIDGTRLAFLRTTGTGSVVVLADADGRNQVEVSMKPLAGGATLNWSPDGRSMAATTDDNGDTGSLWIVDTVNRTIRKTNVVTDYQEVQWRPPDGRQLMVTARASGGLRFVLVSMADDSVEVLPTPVAVVGATLRPGGWSLDGRRFVYAASDDQVHVLDMEGGPDLVIPPSQAQDTGGYPRFSNDGRHILFMEWSTGDPSWLSVAPSDGSKPAIRISDAYQVAIGTHYRWSPDDTAIALEPQFGGARVLLDPAGGPASTPPWMTEEVESWQRLAP
jgi:Tol biopolymer transport system component